MNGRAPAFFFKKKGCSLPPHVSSISLKLILDWNLVSTKNTPSTSSFRPRPLYHVHVPEAPIQQLPGDERVVEVLVDLRDCLFLLLS
jgi:hypothetical protein